MEKINYGEWIKSNLEAKGKSRAWLGNKAGFNQWGIYRWIREDSFPNIDVFLNITRIMAELFDEDYHDYLLQSFEYLPAYKSTMKRINRVNP
tara:strand:+ start:1829 stop:2104 length:276 start_codon:yes stop_codon:yes gene_type:complete